MLLTSTQFKAVNIWYSINVNFWSKNSIAVFTENGGLVENSLLT